MNQAQAEFDAISDEMKDKLVRLATEAEQFPRIPPGGMDVNSTPPRLNRAAIESQFKLDYRNVLWLSVFFNNRQENEILQPYVPALANLETEIRKRVEAYYTAACFGQVVALYVEAAEAGPWHFREYSIELLKLLLPGTKSVVDWGAKPLPLDLSTRAAEYAFVKDMMDLIKDPMYKVSPTDEAPIKTLQTAIAQNCEILSREVERYVFRDYAAALNLLARKSDEELKLAIKYDALLIDNWGDPKYALTRIIQGALVGIISVASSADEKKAAKKKLADSLRTYATVHLDAAVRIANKFVAELPIVGEIKGAPTKRDAYYLSTKQGAHMTTDMAMLFAPILKKNFPEFPINTALELEYRTLRMPTDTPLDIVYEGLKRFYDISDTDAMSPLYAATMRGQWSE